MKNAGEVIIRWPHEEEEVEVGGLQARIKEEIERDTEDIQDIDYEEVQDTKLLNDKI